jgi:hypothetical protein
LQAGKLIIAGLCSHQAKGLRWNTAVLYAKVFSKSILRVRRKMLQHETNFHGIKYGQQYGQQQWAD